MTFCLQLLSLYEYSPISGREVKKIITRFPQSEIYIKTQSVEKQENKH